jgi:chromatin remodeling complex protein RSC6
MWQTGEFIAPDSRRSGGQFSYDNYGDCIEHIKLAGSSKTTKVRKRRATQHIATVKSLSQEAWALIFAEACEYIGKGKRRKRSRSASSRGSEMISEDIIEEEENYTEYVLESD